MGRKIRSLLIDSLFVNIHFKGSILIVSKPVGNNPNLAHIEDTEKTNLRWGKNHGGS